MQTVCFKYTKYLMTRFEKLSDKYYKYIRISNQTHNPFIYVVPTS